MLIFVIQFISVITSFLITNALLLSIHVAINYCRSQVHATMGSFPRSSTDLEASTEALDYFDFDHNSSSSPQVWRQCVHQDNNSKASLLLSNCNLSYIHQRAFDEWPDIKVSKCTKGELILWIIFVQTNLTLINLDGIVAQFNIGIDLFMNS